MEGRREEEEMRERDEGREKGEHKGEEEIVGDATILMLLDKITHVSFTATAESLCLFSHIYLDHRRISNVAYLRCVFCIRTFRGGCFRNVLINYESQIELCTRPRMFTPINALKRYFIFV